MTRDVIGLGLPWDPDGRRGQIAGITVDQRSFPDDRGAAELNGPAEYTGCLIIVGGVHRPDESAMSYREYNSPSEMYRFSIRQSLVMDSKKGRVAGSCIPAMTSK